MYYRYEFSNFYIFMNALRTFKSTENVFQQQLLQKYLLLLFYQTTLVP